MSDDPDMDRMRATWDALQDERKRRVGNLVAIVTAVLLRQCSPGLGWRLWRTSRRDPRVTVVVRSISK
jgi:hypothetical protein